MEAYISTSDSRRVGLLVDTGAYDNLCGTNSAWFKEHLSLLERIGLAPTVRDIPEIAVSGVGSGAASAKQAFTFQGAVLDVDGKAERMYFDTPVVDGSPIPPLWGLRSLRRRRALIDCQGLKIHFLGEGDLRLKLPPGSKSYPLEISDGGHLILPIGEFEALKSQHGNTSQQDAKKVLTFAAEPEIIESTHRCDQDSQTHESRMRMIDEEEWREFQEWRRRRKPALTTM
jgi:hypothetical protein